MTFVARIDTFLCQQPKMNWKKGLFVTTVTGVFLACGFYLQDKMITKQRVRCSEQRLTRQVERERYIESEVKRRTELEQEKPKVESCVCQYLLNTISLFVRSVHAQISRWRNKELFGNERRRLFFVTWFSLQVVDSSNEPVSVRNQNQWRGCKQGTRVSSTTC